MTDQLHFADAATLHDLGTLIKRARRVNEQGVRLQAVDTVLAAWLPVMTPSSLTSGIPAVLGLRTMALAQPSRVDVTVELDAISERLARLNPAEMSLSVPPSQINVPWAAVTPPRSGWAPRGIIPTATLRQAAEAGVEQVTLAVPTSAGAHVVEQVRQNAWSQPVVFGAEEDQTQELGLPAGAAFGAQALGFLSPDDDAEVQVLVNSRWIRLSTAQGHIISRRV